jgi:hypothetical protein
MAFNLSMTGTKDGICKQIAALKEDEEGLKHGLLESYRAAIIADIGRLPAAVNGCHVTIEGNAHQGGRTLNVNIVPRAVAV